MRLLLFSLAAITLLLPACRFQSGTSEADVTPAPTPDLNSVAVADEAAEPAEPAAVEQFSELELGDDPAPAPPTESTLSAPADAQAERSSAEDVFNSIARVLQGAVEGDDDTTNADSSGSVIGSIGRALGKGFQEAASSENAKEE